MPDNKTLWQVSLSKGYFWDSLADCRAREIISVNSTL